MRPFPLLLAIVGVAALMRHRVPVQGGPPQHGLHAMRNRMMKRMLASMPDDSPPKLIMSILPRLQEQNGRILARLEEQNDLLRRLAEAGSGNK